MNNQTFNIHWRIAEDYPPADGEYLVCFMDRGGNYGFPEFMDFENGEWQVSGSEFPSFWTSVPMPLA